MADKPKIAIGETAVGAKVKTVTVLAQITRADGTVEPQHVAAKFSFSSNPLRRLAGFIRTRLTGG